MSKKVVIYSTQVCPYCAAAKALLTKKGVEFEEIGLQSTQDKEKMIERAGGRRTVPQIFIGDTHVGGFDDLSALDDKGELNKMLGL